VPFLVRNAIDQHEVPLGAGILARFSNPRSLRPRLFPPSEILTAR
jgi:hypothetical protein